MQGWKSPFKKLAHVDLLHLARRLWRDRLPQPDSGKLGGSNLHASRTDEEIPGWMIPSCILIIYEGDAFHACFITMPWM
jgi:uncharacterized protein YprB with RNaseH-like and TPR domain